MLINKLWCFLFSRHHNKYIIIIDVFDIYSYPILMFKFVVTGFCLLFNGRSRATAQKLPGALQEHTELFSIKNEKGNWAMLGCWFVYLIGTEGVFSVHFHTFPYCTTKKNSSGCINVNWLYLCYIIMLLSIILLPHLFFCTGRDKNLEGKSLQVRTSTI